MSRMDTINSVLEIHSPYLDGDKENFKRLVFSSSTRIL